MVLQIVAAMAFGVVAVCDLIVAWMSIRQRTTSGKVLGSTCIGAALVTASYIISVYVEDYFLYSVLSSVYFGSIDLTLLSLVYFVHSYVSGRGVKKKSKIWPLLCVWSAADLLVLIVNPFWEISIHYVHIESVLSHYTYEMLTLYKLHLLLAYVSLAAVMFYLFRKSRAVPTAYRKQYDYAILSLVLVIFINAFYLYMPTEDGIHILDYSLLGYSLAAFLFYWICFEYTERGLLDVLRNHIFTNFDRGLLLYDYENRLAMENKKAQEILKGFLPGQEPDFDDMLRLMGKDAASLAKREADGQKYSVQCYPTQNGVTCPIICDYRALIGGQNEVIGKLFVLSELSSDFDPITGFYFWDSYKRRGNETSAEVRTAVACDIKGLAEINTRYGRTRGDKELRRLARLMRMAFPAGTVFIRCSEATLVALCVGQDEETARTYVDRMQEALQKPRSDQQPLEYQSGVKSCAADEDVCSVVEGAVEVLQMRKLLDPTSHHSEALYSLIKILKTCDDDLEAHVRRTQKLGMELGKRIHLSEEQQSNLSLLALLHDVGKIGVPLDILNKPGKLTDAEWGVLAKHVEKGYQIANSYAELRGIADMILHHHERWDGKGYPVGLSKESIPLLSRVIAVVDSYDAMTNDRAYRRAMSPQEACNELKRCSGTQFDPYLVTEFLQMLLEHGVIDSIPDAAAAQAAYASKHSQPVPESKDLEQSAPYSPERIHLMRYSRYILNSDKKIIQADDTFTRLTGYTMQDIQEQGLSQLDLIFPDDREEYGRRVFRELERSAAAYLEHWIRKKDGGATFVFCCGRRYFDSAEREERVEILLCDTASSYSVRSVIAQEHNRASSRLERWENKYRRDSLTGLLNHEAFKNDVESRLSTGGGIRAMMLMMDVDHFKEYNDRYGHQAGDNFLIMVAQALMSTLRKNDFACRMGGDEFAALLVFQADVPKEVMMRRAGQIFDKINMILTSIENNGTSLSMGGAFYGESCQSFNELYRAADQALYRSKESGRAKISWS